MKPTFLNQCERCTKCSQEIIPSALGMIFDHELEKGETRDSDLEVKSLFPNRIEAVVRDGVSFAFVLQRLSSVLLFPIEL